jgi:hypothetical protein
MMLAHIGGVPVEETLLAFGPALFAAAGYAAARLRGVSQRAGRRRRAQVP